MKINFAYIMGSVRISIKGLFREIVRGSISRIYYYNKIKYNEQSEEILSNYINSRLLKIGKALVLKNANPFEIKKILSSYRIISKQDVKTNPEDYENNKYGKYFFNYNKTSGTTGTPLRIKQTLECVQIEEAFVYRQLKWMGYKLGDRKVWLRGDMIVPMETTNSPFWRRDFITNTLYMSSYHISKETIRSYIEKLEQFNPIVIQAYPSSIGLLASWLESNDFFYQGEKLKGILTSSETLSLEMRNIIEERFQCQVFDWYGQSERVCAIGTCEQGNYHLLTDYSLVDFIDNNGCKEIVGTSLNNLATPLVRYKTGDFVEMSSNKCECGRVFPVVKKIHGRVDEIITLSNGTQIGRLDHIFKDINNLMESQIVQTNPDTFIINIVVSLNFKEEDEKHIMRNAHERLGNVDITIQRCKQIPRGANGKFKFIIPFKGYLSDK